MIVRLRTTQTTQQVDPLVPDSRAAPLIDKKSAGLHSELTRDTEAESIGRRLRNRFILANAIIWIAVIVAVRLIFF